MDILSWISPQARECWLVIIKAACQLKQHYTKTRGSQQKEENVISLLHGSLGLWNVTAQKALSAKGLIWTNKRMAEGDWKRASNIMPDASYKRTYDII